MTRIAAIVLAAGASSRMGPGTPKALLRLEEGDTFLERAVRLAATAGADPVVVVTGAHRLSAPAPAHSVENRDWAQGQLSSLKVGLAEVAHGAVDGALVALVDHPLVRQATFVELVAAFARTHAPVVRPTHSGRPGHPIIFSAAIFDELRATPLAEGARPVIARHRDEIVDVEVDDPGILVDFDTRADLEVAGLVAGTGRIVR